MRTSTRSLGLLLSLTMTILFAGCSGKRINEAEASAQKWAEKLDMRTDDAGIYIKWKKKTLPENDPWGNPFRIAYSQGGLAQNLTVRSFGPDGKSHTKDDIMAKRASANLKGIGEGAKKNVEEFSEKAAKGLAKGLIKGIKDGIKGKVSGKTSKEDE